MLIFGPFHSSVVWLYSCVGLFVFVLLCFIGSVVIIIIFLTGGNFPITDRHVGDFFDKWTLLALYWLLFRWAVSWFMWGLCFLDVSVNGFLVTN